MDMACSDSVSMCASGVASHAMSRSSAGHLHTHRY